MSEKGFEPAGKLPEGSLGRRIRLGTNCFPMRIGDEAARVVSHRQSVRLRDGGRAEPSCTVRRDIAEKLQREHPTRFGSCPLVIGSRSPEVYTVGHISTKRTVNVMVRCPDPYGREVWYEVLLRRTSESRIVDLREKMITVLSTMVNHHLALRYQMLSGDFDSFDVGHRCPANVAADLSAFLRCRQGLVVHVARFAGANDQLHLAVNLMPTVLSNEQSLVHFLQNDERTKDFMTTERMRVGLTHADVEYLTKVLYQLQVKEVYSGRSSVFRIIRVTFRGADSTEYTTQWKSPNENPVSVAEYLRTHHACELLYPKLNCLQVAPEDRKIYLPMEVCTLLKDQCMRERLTDNEARKFRDLAFLKAREVPDIVTSLVRETDIGSFPPLRAVKCTVAEEPVHVIGRVLPTPSLSGREKISIKDGTFNMEGFIPHKPVELHNWKAVHHRHIARGFRPRDSVKSFVQKLRKVAEEMGMTICQPPIEVAGRYPDPLTDLEPLASFNPNLQLAMFFMRPGFRRMYAEYKRYVNSQVCMLSQFIDSETYYQSEEPEESKLRNLVLQLNAKIGGVNFVVNWGEIPCLRHFMSSSVLFLGITTSRPKRRWISCPTIGVVVGVYDVDRGGYSTRVRPQGWRHDVLDLKEMLLCILADAYEGNRGRKPERIVVYRLELTEKMVDVVHEELHRIEDACKEIAMDETYVPPITYIVVQKSRTFRLFCDEKDAVGEAGNIPPGTVIEHYFTHPSLRDFYLCSHVGHMGVSRPMHFTILHDDNDLSMDQLEMLTYALSYLSQRSADTVSLPMPAFYAKLAAAMTRTQVSENIRELQTVIPENPVTTLNKSCTVDSCNPLKSKLFYL